MPLLLAAAAVAATSTLKDVSGRAVPVAGLHAKGPAVLWFTNLCANCQGGFPGMSDVTRAIADAHATVTAVSFVKNDRARVEGLLKALHPAFPIYLDPQGAVTQQFTGMKPATACPLVNLVILNRRGTPVWKGHYPGVTPGELVRRVREAAAAR